MLLLAVVALHVLSLLRWLVWGVVDTRRPFARRALGPARALLVGW
ncbi:hypothetical protein DB32_005098 [Sandaracinus amylolyticus]|uniref:Uncharacterized protein n=1 Tax=Sandaracinus amylolyticus TaxID=927083 RepID=A0A0F6SG24_9BACT|nr:hypothetical protein DB32_005098 [Sandaracinus amylolyticus]